MEEPLSKYKAKIKEEGQRLKKTIQQTKVIGGKAVDQWISL